MRLEATNPRIIDNSREEEDSEDDSDRNIESTESFTVYYPDGSLTRLFGGTTDPAIFKRHAEAMKRAGGELCLSVAVSSAFV